MILFISKYWYNRADDMTDILLKVTLSIITVTLPESFETFWLITTPSVQIKQPIKSQLLTNSVFGTAALSGNRFRLDYCVCNYVVCSLFTVKMTYNILLWHLMVLIPYTNEKSISLSITQSVYATIDILVSVSHHILFLLPLQQKWRFLQFWCVVL